MDTGYIDKIASDFEKYCEGAGLDTAEKRSRAMRGLFDRLAAGSAQERELTAISAQNAVLEVIDRDTGLIFRRYLELEYSESGNGIRLRGEDITGRETSIVFLSGSAIERMNELRGYGPDSPRCSDG